MYKAVLFFLSLIFGLFLVGHTLAPKGLPPAERELAAPASRQAGQPLSEAEYKKLKVALSSFDLAAGLTRADFEIMPEGRAYTFYSLLGAFWLVLGLKTLGRPQKPQS